MNAVSKFGPYVDSSPDKRPVHNPLAALAVVGKAWMSYREWLIDRAETVLPETFEQDPRKACTYLEALIQHGQIKTAESARVLIESMVSEDHLDVNTIQHDVLDVLAPFDEDKSDAAEQPATVFPTTVKHTPNPLGEFKTYRRNMTVRDNTGKVEGTHDLTARANQFLRTATIDAHGDCETCETSDNGPCDVLKQELTYVGLLGTQDQMWPENVNHEPMVETVEYVNVRETENGNVVERVRKSVTTSPVVWFCGAPYLRNEFGEMQGALLSPASGIALGSKYKANGERVGAVAVGRPDKVQHVTKHDTGPEMATGADMPAFLRLGHTFTSSLSVSRLATQFRGRIIVGHRKAVATATHAAGRDVAGRAATAQRVAEQAASEPVFESADVAADHARRVLGLGMTTLVLRVGDTRVTVTARDGMRGFKVRVKSPGVKLKDTTATDPAYVAAAIRRHVTV